MSVLADVILVVHLLFVCFVVGGLLAIWTGALAGWRWIRNRAFRVAHLAAIAFVAAETALGIACPLTVWEDALRGSQSSAGFIERWVHGILFYDFPEWVFGVAYVVFALVVAVTYWLAPPVVRPGRSSRLPHTEK